MLDEDNNVIETEKTLREGEAPAEVLEAANQAVPSGQLASVELVERPDATEYHVKKRDGQVTYKVVVAADGTVLRKVREHRAEIEIPLR